MPGTQIVRNRWQGGFQQFLAKEGYIVFSMDTRGMAGRGRDFKNLATEIWRIIYPKIMLRVFSI